VKTTTVVLGALLATWGASPGAGQEQCLRLELDGRVLEGTPVSWSAAEVLLLGRDGQLWNFAPDDVQRFEPRAFPFQSYSQSELRARLAREFGRGFDVSGTGNYLVVHPSGERNRWAERFEVLYRSFVQYFAARGLQPAPLQFPLVAVVFPGEAQFRAYVGAQGIRLPQQTRGFYSPRTNRVLLYDAAPGNGARQWQLNAATIVHEAAHQAAFNTGIHNRYAAAPRWLIEGLGTMFEAPGVWDSRSYPLQRHRVHHHLLSIAQSDMSRGRPRWSLEEFVASDEPFKVDAASAYAEAWALTFYLAEGQPRSYWSLLQSTAQRRRGTPHNASFRRRVFEDAVGQDIPMFEARWLRFVRDLE